LARCLKHVESDMEINYGDAFGARVKEKFDDGVRPGRTQNEIMKKWMNSQRVVLRFNEIFTRRMDEVEDPINNFENVVQESFSEYARVNGRPFAKLAI
jgi:hypothetical protein